MPSLVRAESSERDALLEFLEAQRAGLRRAVIGLTDEQAASRPSASELTLSGLIKHAAICEHFWVQCTLMGRDEPSQGGQGFELLPGETLNGLLTRYETVALETVEAVNMLPDLDVTVALPDAPWFPPGSKRTARWILLHLIEEAARHAGHADIIRESLDGEVAFGLMAKEQEEEHAQQA